MATDIRAPKSVRALPPALVGLLAICAAAPVWSLVALPAPAAIYTSHGPLGVLLLVACYWVLPLALAGTILARSALFLAVFATECVALLLGVWHLSSGTDVEWGRYAVIALAGLAGVLFASKDLIAPFINVDSPSWRQTPRLASSIRVRGRLHQGAPSVDLVVDDFSMKGMAISLNIDDIEDGKELRRGDPIDVFDVKGKVVVPCEIAWVKTDGPLVSMGVKASDPKPMDALVASFRQKEARKGLVVPFWLGRLWLNQGVRKLSLVLWVGLIMAAFGSPTVTTGNAGAHYKGSTPPAVAPQTATPAQDAVFGGSAAP